MRHPTLDEIRAALRGKLDAAEEGPEGPAAAVAAVLREGAGGVELLFIRRAKRRGDPWSGHMAWPGGRREPSDETMVACAVRETREELGLDLDRDAELIGSLRPLRFSSSRFTRLRAVFAYVFALNGAPVLRPGDEVQEAVWIPLAYFGAWSSRRPWVWLAKWLPPVPPAFRFEGRVIWGLTQSMLGDLLARIAVGPTRDWQAAGRDRPERST